MAGEGGEASRYDMAPQSSADLAEAQDIEPPRSAEAPAPPPEAPAVERQIIRTADYRIQVKDVRASAARVKKLVADNGGYLAQENLTNSNYELNNHLVIRVPAGRFDSLLQAIGGDAEFTNYLRIDAQDVTEEYVDVQTRLQTKREVRDRYIDILRHQARTVEDILNAEDKIRVLQEEIEAQEARLRYLTNQVAFSTINLDLYQPVEYRPEPTAYHESFGSRLLGSLRGGWVLLVDIFLGLIRIWPLLVLGGLLWWQRRRLFGRWRRRGEDKR